MKLSDSYTLKKIENNLQFLNLQVLDNNNTTSLFGENCIHFNNYKVLDNHIILDFDLNTSFVQDKKDIFEIQFYIERSKNLKILIENSFANTFQLNEPLDIHFFDKSFQIEFSLIEGEGKFWGHLYYANRPSRSIKNQFQALDWVIGLRTVRRGLGCRVRAKISI